MPPVPRSRSDLLKGTRLGSYEVGELIGHGGMGSVFEASHVGLSKAVAIKVLHEHVAQSEAMRARFVREARLAATLEHPHVVNILDVGVEGGTAYLVMELLQGQDLALYLRTEKKVPLEAALAIFLPVASALAFAHDHGVVHRDLKPANIFLSRDRHGEILPKIVDFGLSKLLTAEEALTESDVVIGTLEYMAPEQTFGTARAGVRSDQYSLAAILYETVTGHLPFHRADTRELLDAIRYAPVVLPSALESSLPMAFDDAVVRALSREPEDRFPDVRAFAHALLPFADRKAARFWQRDFGSVTGLESLPAPVSAAGPRSAREPTLPEVDLESEAGITGRVEDEEAESDTLMGVPPPPPPLPSAPGSSTFHIKGVAYRSVVMLVEHKVPGGLSAVDAELADGPTSAFVRQPFLVASRYDILPMLPLNVAIARLLGKSLEALAAEQGTAQARYDVSYVYRRPFELMTLDTVHTYFPRFTGQYYESGDCTAERVGAGHVLVRRKRMPAYVLPWFVSIHEAYASEVLRLKGAKSVVAVTRPPLETGTRRGVVVVDLEVDLTWAG